MCSENPNCVVWHRKSYLKGVIWCDYRFSFFSLWRVTSWLCIDKIPEVSKTKVSKPKRYSLKFRLWQSRLVWKHIRASALCLSRDSVPPRLELMVKLKTLLTVFTFILKAKARDYGNGHSISDSCLWCLSQCSGSVGQSEQTTLVGRRGFVENGVFERGRA